MIFITNAAQKYFVQLLKKKKTGTQIRIFVMNPGRYNAECGISYCPTEEIEVNDLQLKFDEFIAYIDEYSAPYLKDAEIDLIDDKLGIQLTLKTPNIKIPEIDCQASLVERVKHVLCVDINPQLASHGGNITLIEITPDMFALLQFSGGCHGCSMVHHTLKENIEKKLLEMFPQLQGVQDITEHNHGEHSYY
ncbi:Fe-S biogenesis protein NfuA [Candidatus Palibaumannia cicadellinicola]|uniref:Fe/S biogenesis protein NfuA n=1 Tax=Candidatus Palibaumannia cicadellinicola TaxID=186490 RepID=A0A088MYY2_9GAMM|nr:Fe-S biogenesis protein NfuA [Candidatus Baumannia cicadellinicola]AIN47404.1 NfuA Fe-S protein maturation [Candidatus Baumannia cicadellinicola]